MNENLDGNIQVLVNQNENTISINCENSMSQIFAVKLYDGIGREVSRIENTSNTKSLKLQMPTQAGTYILSIETNNKIYRSKIVVGKYIRLRKPVSESLMPIKNVDSEIEFSVRVSDIAYKEIA